MDEHIKYGSISKGTNSVIVGRDEKGCKMDVDGRQRASTIAGLEKCSLVNVDQEKCSGVNVDPSRVNVDKTKKLYF